MLSRYKTSINRKIANVIIAWCVIVAAVTALVIAQVEPYPEMAAPVQASPPGSPQEADAGETPDVIITDGFNGQAIQSLSFKEGTTIKSALRMLALKYQKNIIPTERVEGTITVTDLFNVTFDEALQAIIGMNKYEQTKDNFIRVYTPEEFEQIAADKRRMEDVSFILNYITADEAQKMIEPLLSGEGAISITTGSEKGVPAGESISSDSAGGDSMAFQDTVVIKDYPENISAAERLIKKLDVRPKQVLIEATILSAVLTEDMEFGVDLSFANGVSITGTAASGGTADAVLGGYIDGSQTSGLTPIGQVGSWSQAGMPVEISGFAKAGSNGLRFGISAGDVAVILTALEQITDTTILANPKILAVNKQLGQVYIGTKIGYRENDIITDGGATQQGAVKFLDTGTKLAFRPYIGDNGYIRMQIHPKDSTGALNAQGVPNETSSELATNIIVRDGQTIIIGGMFRDVVTSTTKQVPILGSIPIIGDIFKGIDDNSKREEVIVLMTPHIIDEPDELADDDAVSDVKKISRGAHKELSWISLARQADDAFEKAVVLYSDGKSDEALKQVNWAISLRPTFMQAIRLRDKIVHEAAGSGKDSIEEIMLGIIERERIVWHR